MAEHAEVDIAVIGAGLAGAVAGFFAARGGCSTLVLAGDQLGGELVNLSQIEDFPGFPQGVSGYELCPAVQEQAQDAGAIFEMDSATRLAREEGHWRVEMAQGSVVARSVICATGTRFRCLGLPGEEELVGRGVSHCATCDGPMMTDRRVIVVGGGDSGLTEAFELVRYASEVVVVEHAKELSAQHVYRERLAKEAKIKVLLDSELEEIAGQGRVEAVSIRLANGERRRLEAGGVFVYAGLEPVAPELPELRRDGGGHLVTDLWLRTSLRGLFAAGAVRCGFSGQAVSAAGDGATAALGAQRYLKDGSWPTEAVFDVLATQEQA
jgi:thioredoxin reductase (NADPH)